MKLYDVFFLAIFKSRLRVDLLEGTERKRKEVSDGALLDVAGIHVTHPLFQLNPQVSGEYLAC
jgi:hypothetical protein